MRRAGVVGCVGVVVALAAVWALAALAAGEDAPAPSAIARALPSHYRLLVTETSDHGRLHVASYGPPTLSDSYDAPLSIQSFRSTGDPDGELVARDGDRPTAVRGHSGLMRTLTDEDRPYAHELVWRERANLIVSVTAPLATRKRTLHRIAERVKVIGEPAWRKLYAQASAAAQLGHVSRNMRRVGVEHGVLAGHRWRLSALIPPHFPLSRDDRRPSCFALRYRHRVGHGYGCGMIENWQRIGGEMFVFGALYRPARHLVIRPVQGHAFRIRTRTFSIARGPRVNYFAVPLPSDACAVTLNGAVTGPIRGRDRRRCAKSAR